MKTIKQLLTTIAVLLCSVMAHAYDFEVDGIFYNITSAGNLAIEVTYKDTKYNTYSGNVVIPETVAYNGKTYRVKSIGNKAFYNCTELTNVTLPNNIESIGSEAFYNCTELTTITLPNNIKSIGSEAFYGCESITNITIPSSVTFIGDATFHNCTSLKDLRIEDGEMSLEFYHNSSYRKGSAFDYSPLENIYLGRNIKYSTSLNAGRSPFYNKQLLTSLTISDYVTTIGEYMFYGCSGLTSVIIPNSVTSIRTYAFTDCTNLKDIFYTSTTPPTSLWMVENTYVPNKEVYSKVQVSGGSGNFIEYVTFNNTTFTYGETINTTFVNNLENKGYTANASIPELPRNVGTHTIEISFSFSKNGENINVNIPYTYTVNKATLTAKADTITRLYGDNNPELTISYNGFVYNENESVLTNKGTATTSAIAKSNVGEYQITVSGVNADNYEIQYEIGILRINKAPLTVIANNATKIYGDNNPQFTLNYSGLKNNETSPEMINAFNVTTTASKTSNVGEYDITVSGGEAKNYEVTTYTSGKLSITKATLVLTANNATKVYGDANPSFDFSCMGLKNNDVKDEIFITNPTISCSVTNSSNTGSYDITINGGETYNYEITYYKKGTLTITKAPLTLVANNYTRLYGDENPTFEYTCTGLKNSDKLNEIFDTKPKAVCTATKSSAVGEYKISFTGGVAQNYNITNSVEGILTINKASITVMANNLTKIYGDENPEYALTYTGLKNDEIAPEMTSAFNISTDATKTSNVGEYNITISGGVMKNYEIANYINGKLSVLKAPLTVTATNITKIYGDRNPEFKYSYDGEKNNDDENAIFETRPTISCDTDEKSGAGEYEIVINGATSNNYEITYKTGVLSINKREITVSTKNYTRKYGEENPEFEISYNGFVNNENESALLIKPKAKTIAEKDSDVGVYDINTEGGDADNYSFAYKKGTLTIEKANQTIIWEQEFNDLEIGSQIELTATATSGLDIEYVIPDNDFISVYTIGSTTYLDCYGAGEIAIRATQNGNKNYNSAVRISKVIKVGTSETGLSDVLADVVVNIKDNIISLTGANNYNVTIYTVNGVLVKEIDQYAGEEIILDRGIYIIRIENKSIKIMI